MILGKMQVAKKVDIPTGALPVLCMNYEFNNKLYISNNLGTSWTDKTLPGAHRWAGMNAKNRGMYIVMVTYNTTEKTYYSLNGGTTILDDGYNARYGTGCKISPDGQVIVSVAGLGNTGFRISINGGTNWLNKSVQYNTNDVAISQDGGIIYVSDYGQGLYKSTDYGTTWTKILNNASLTCATSSDGSRVYSKSYVNKDRIYTSASGGSIFSFTTLSRNVVSGCLSTDDSGQYVVLAGGSDIFFSNDYGASFIDIASKLNGFYMTGNSNQYVSPTGQYIAIPSFVGSNYVVYVSSDYGVTFTSKALPLASGTPRGFAIS